MNTFLIGATQFLLQFQKNHRRRNDCLHELHQRIEAIRVDVGGEIPTAMSQLNSKETAHSRRNLWILPLFSARRADMPSPQWKEYLTYDIEIELENNPKYARISALESLRKTNAKVLLIYSEDDKTVHKKDHFDPLLHALQARKNIEFLLVNGKDHNPHYTADAVQYKNDFWKTTEKAIKQKKLETAEQQQEFMSRYDWHRMTTQDEDVWEKILAHFEK